MVDEEDEDELEGEGEDVEIESTTAVSPSNEGGDYQPPTSHRLGKPIMARRRTLTNIVIVRFCLCSDTSQTRDLRHLMDTGICVCHASQPTTEETQLAVFEEELMSRSLGCQLSRPFRCCSVCA